MQIYQRRKRAAVVCTRDLTHLLLDFSTWHVSPLYKLCFEKCLNGTDFKLHHQCCYCKIRPRSISTGTFDQHNLLNPGNQLSAGLVLFEDHFLCSDIIDDDLPWDVRKDDS